MTYGAKESNPSEGSGLGLLVLGLALVSAGWAYGTGVIQAVVVICGIAGFVAAFAVLRQARLAG
ncbi:MAG TPA: hypothetical protein VFC51_02980 [Chloroflexota bacterium]|nr:hypothetical protein [Chloroflexota bacterium]